MQKDERGNDDCVRWTNANVRFSKTSKDNADEIGNIGGGGIIDK